MYLYCSVLAQKSELVEDVFPQGKRKGYKKLLVRNDSSMGVHKIPMQKEYDEALEGNIDLDKKQLS